MVKEYWMIDGIGIDVSFVEKHLDNEKVVRFLDDHDVQDAALQKMLEANQFDSFDIEDFLYGGAPYESRYRFDSLGDLLTFCDDTDSLTYCDDGCSGEYVYYPRSFPWEHVANEPKSVEEVHRRIVDAVQKLTSLTREEIEATIDDELYVAGMG